MCSYFPDLIKYHTIIHSLKGSRPPKPKHLQVTYRCKVGGCFGDDAREQPALCKSTCPGLEGDDVRR